MRILSAITAECRAKGCRLNRLGIAVLLITAANAPAQVDMERPPINYSQAPVDDAVHRLADAIEAGEVTLERDRRLGWLPAVLEQLDVPASSQTLVFSKTSLQRDKISPTRPRAVYFNDDVYVGYVRHGDVLELSAVDPHLGAIFYTVDQTNHTRPVITRDGGQCLACHATRRTRSVPGYLVRSVYPDVLGEPAFGHGTTTTDHTTPLADRFGGWYVTGSHGKVRHRGNAIAFNDASESAATETVNRDPIDRELGANLDVLDGLVDTRPYLQPGSDLVALMVLEHQTQAHNAITAANYRARTAIYYEEAMNRSFDRPKGTLGPGAIRQIESTGEELLEYLLFSGEAQLESPIAGTSTFAEEFAALGPRDSQGRSLRDFDLRRRLFRYPLSFLIYDDSIDALPERLQDYLRRRLTEVLTGEDDSEPFQHLSRRTRRAIYEILKTTRPERLM